MLQAPQIPRRDFRWGTILRLGAVQAALGGLVVLSTSTFNRILVVELALAAVIPGALVGVHHVMQLLRPRMGHGADSGRRHTPWIVGGMLVLAAGAMLAAVAIAVAGTNTELGIALAVLGYAGIGAGVSACGTSILTLLAKGVAPARRGAAATAVWMMMIAGFAVTAGVVGGLLEPYSPARLVAVTAGVGVIAMVITLLAMRRLESDDGVASNAAGGVSLADTRAFRRALAEVWAERDARRFTAFVFVSMLAYSAQDLILEPFAGAIFGWTPGATTQLAGMQHGGVLVGMLLVAITTAAFAGRRVASLRGWVAAGCFGSAVMMFGLVCAALSRDPTWPLAANVFALGVANGAFSIAAIASMMTLATTGTSGREGTRMGLWGAAQAIAFGVGGFLGTILVDLARSLELGPPAFAYALVFALESIGFAVALRLALASTLPESPRPIRHTVARRHVALSGDFPEPTTP